MQKNKKTKTKYKNNPQNDHDLFFFSVIFFRIFGAQFFCIFGIQGFISVAPPAEPRGEKKLFFVQILGGEKLLKFGEKWAVKNF